MEITKVNIAEKLSIFNDHWNPRIVGELNGQHVKLVKFQGEFTCLPAGRFGIHMNSKMKCSWF